MGPLGGIGIGIGQGLVGGLLGGGNEPQETSNVLPARGQIDLLNLLLRRGISGQGEFGFGQAARSGTATLRDMLGQRGISPGSGVYASSLAQMLGQASALDNQNRYSQLMGLIQAQPWTVNSQHFGGSYWNKYIHGME